MKKLIITLFLITNGIYLFAQDTFQKELFSTNLVLKYRSDIDLSDQKIVNVKKTHSDHISEFNSIKWDLDAELVVLNKLLSSYKVDETSSLAQMEKVMELEDKLKRIRLKMLIKIKNELNKSQQKKLKELRTDKDIESLDLIIPIDITKRIIIRGTGDKSKKNSPLFIIIDKKGERKIPVGSVESLDQSKIKSIEVLKNTNAIKKYGAEGKNGVVIIHIKE